MAALDDELDSDLPGYTRPRSVYETGEEPVSALDGETAPEDEEVGYGGGGDDLAGASAALARLRPAPAGSARAALDQVLAQRLAERAAAPAAPGFGVIGRDPEALRRMIVPDAGEVIYSRPEAEKPKEDTGGMSQIAIRGLARATEDLKQGKDIAEGKKPRDSAVPLADYEQPLEVTDFADPSMTAKKLWYGLFKSYPALGTSLLGTAGGVAVGGAVAGPPGAAVGGIFGGAAGMGFGGMLQEIGPAYNGELAALKGDNPDREITAEEDAKAWNSAVTRAGISGGIGGAASLALFGFGKPVGDALKGVLTPVVAGAAKPVAGLPLRAATQVVGQTGISVGSEVGISAIEGKPLDTNLSQAVAGGIANVVPDVAAAAGGRAVRRIMRGREGEVTPGVSDDQAAALAAEGGHTWTPAAPRGEHQWTPAPPSEPFGRPEGTPPPPTMGPGPFPIAPPGGRGPDMPAFEQGTHTFTPAQPPASGPEGVVQPPVRPGPGPVPMAPPGGGPPPIQPFEAGEHTWTPAEPPAPTPGPPFPPGPEGPARPGPAPFPTRPPGGPEGPPTEGPFAPAPPPPPPPPTPPAPEPPGLSRLQRAVGMEEPPVPPIAPAAEGIGPRSRIQEQYGTPGVGERTLIEPDHLDAARSVAKNEGGDVIGKGATAEEALADAQARQRAPYEEQATAAEQAKPAEAGTKEQPVTAAEKAPPAGAAKPEPAASGRDAVPETPVKQTRAEVVKAKGEARRTAAEQIIADRKTEAEARVKRVTEKARQRAEAKAAAKAESVTKTDESSAQKPAPKTGPVTKSGGTEKVAPGAPLRTTTEGRSARAPELAAAAGEQAQAALTKYEKILKDWTDGKVDKATLDRAKAEYNARLKEIEGSTTKAGAYVSPGEAVEAQAPRPVRAQPTEMQEGARSESARHTTQSSHTLARRMAPEPTEKFAVPEGLNTVRKAQHIVGNILAGQPLADAIAAFGKKEPGSVGRPRKVETLSSHIRQFLKEADTSTAEQSRRQALDATVARLKKLPPEPVPGEASPQRRAILDDLNKQLEQLDEVRANRAKLEDALTQIEALEAGSRGPKSIRRRITELVSRSTTPFEFLARRREVNEPILQHIQRSGDAGASLHRLLDDFIANKNANGMTPQLTELARILRGVVPDGKVRQGEGIIPGDAVGSYDPVIGDIYLNTNAARQEGNAAVTLLHETIHKPTVDYINHLYRTPEANLNPQELAHKFALDSIRGEIDRVYVEGGPRTHAEDFELGYAGEMYDTPYLTGPHELAAQLLTQPELHRFLSRETASPEFRRALDSVGMGIGQKASIWDGFKKIVRNFFGVPDKLDSVFDYVLRPLTEIVETGARFGRAADVAEINQIRRQNNEVLGPAKLRDSASLKQIRDALGDTAGPKGRSVLRGVFQAATLGAIHDAIKPYVPSVTLHRAALEAVTHASEAERTRPVTTHGANGQPIVEAHIDKTMRLVNELKRGPDGDKVQPLMTEATLAEVSLSDPTKNTHMVTPEQQAVVARLQHEFDQLDPRAQQTYREVNELYNDRDRVAREARVRQYTEAALPDLTPAQHNDVVRHMSTLGGIEDIINNTDQSALAGRLGARWANSKDLVTLLAETERGGFVRGDYFPANRYGEYVVSAGTPNTPSYIVRMFEKSSEAKDFKAYLETSEAADPSRNIPARAGRSDVSQVFTKSKQGFTAGMRLDQALGTLDRAMERSGLGEDAQRVLRDLYSGQLIQQGTRMSTRTMRREGIAGASIEQARNLMVDFLGHSSRVGHLKHQGEVLRSQFQMEKERDMLHRAGHGTPTGVDAQGNPIYSPTPQASRTAVMVAQLGTEELRTRLAPVDGDITSDLMGRGTRGLTTLTVADALIRPAHLVMQLAGTHAAAMSLIAGRHGIGSVFGLTRAYAQLAGPALRGAGTNAMAAYHRELKAANWDLAKLYRERLYRADDISNQHVDLLIDELNRSNLINQTKIREMQRMAGPDGWLGGNGPVNFIGRTLDIFGAGEHALDSMMRTATAKAAFVAELRKNGGDVAGAIEYAKQTARNALPDYNHYNKSRLASAQSSLGKYGAPLITQFKQFGLHMYGVQGNLIAEGIRNAKGTEARREAWKSLAYLQASHALMYGGIGASVFGSLPAMVGFGLYDYLPEWLGGEGADRPHTNKEMQTRARTWVRDISGSKTLADVFDRGLPMTMGVDVHRSLKFTNLLGIPELQTFDAKGYGEFMLELMTGAAGGTATDLAEAASKVRKGDVRVETIAKLMPRVIEDPLTAYQWSQHGLKTGKGDRTIVPAEKFSTGDIIAKGLGFIPSRSSDAREARSMINLDQKVVEDAHKNILDRLVRAKGNERGAILAEITRYNTAARPEDRITGQQIQSRLRDQARVNAQPQLYGMDVPKRDTLAAIEMTRAYR